MKVERVQVGCLDTVGPVPNPPAWIEFQDCEWEVCLDSTNTAKLNRYLESLQRWARDAETRCKLETTEEDHEAPIPSSAVIVRSRYPR